MTYYRESIVLRMPQVDPCGKRRRHGTLWHQGILHTAVNCAAHIVVLDRGAVGGTRQRKHNTHATAGCEAEWECGRHTELLTSQATLSGDPDEIV